MPATIRVDALNNVTLKGVVTRVNQYAETGGWMSSSIRKYAVFVKILDPPEALKPGMNSSVTIQVQYEPDVLLAPVQTIYSVQDKQFCLVRNGENWETLEVEIAGDNSQMVYIKSGVEEGDELVMNPGAYKQYMELPEFQAESKIDLPEGVVAEGGKTSQEAAGRPGGPRPGGPRSGGPGGGQVGGEFSIDGMIDGMMGRYDTSGDGMIDRDEMGSLSDRARGMVEAADENRDGSVSRTELKYAMEERMQEGGFGGGGGGQRGGGGGIGGGGGGQRAGGGAGGKRDGGGGGGKRDGGGGGGKRNGGGQRGVQ